MRRYRLWPWVLTVVMLGSSAAVAATGAGNDANRTHHAGRSDPPAELSGAWIRVSSPTTPQPPTTLANTQWRLVELQSIGEKPGTQRPEMPGRYVLRLEADGTATLWLNCHRVTLTWAARPPGRTAQGGFEFGRLGQNTAPCPTPGMEQTILRQVSLVRSFTFKEGHLHLGSKAEGAVYVWAQDKATSANIREPAAAGPKASPEPRVAPKDAPVPGGRSTEAASAGAWQVARRVNLREQPSTQSRVLAVLNPGTRLARGACQAAEGREWCRVTVQPGGGEGFVAAEYLNPVR